MKGQLKPDAMLRTFGADPEMFVLRENGVPVPAFKFLPSKEDALPSFYGPGNPFKLFWDGFQAEWSYRHGRVQIPHLLDDIGAGIAGLDLAAKKYNANAYLTLLNVVKIDKDVMEAAGDAHVEFGCMPSYNIYSNKGEGIPNPRKLLYRFAGGHMHFGGWKKKPNYTKIVKLLDAILGVWAVSAAREFDNPMRRKYYGLAGEHRRPIYDNKTYGIEYRVLSNFWLTSPNIANAVWQLAHLILRLAESKYAERWDVGEGQVQSVINHCNYLQAAQILERNSEMFTWLISHLCDPEAQRFLLIGLGGFSCDHYLLEQEWNL